MTLPLINISAHYPSLLGNLCSNKNRDSWTRTLRSRSRQTPAHPICSCQVIRSSQYPKTQVKQMKLCSQVSTFLGRLSPAAALPTAPLGTRTLEGSQPSTCLGGPFKLQELILNFCTHNIEGPPTLWKATHRPPATGNSDDKKLHLIFVIGWATNFRCLPNLLAHNHCL
jgi:hypothetical protein